MIVNYYQTGTLLKAGIDQQINKVVEYAVMNSDNTLIAPYVLEGMLSRSRALLSTPMADVFGRISSNQHTESIVAPMFLRNTDGVPEILTSPGLVVDLKQSQNRAHQGMASIRDRVLVNLTSVIRLDQQRSELVLTDTDSLHNFYVRAILVAGYHDLRQSWVPSAVADFLIKSYSIIISAMISARYQCSFAEQTTIGALCALYFSNLMLDSSDKITNPLYFKASAYLGSRYELDRIADSVTCSPDKFTIDELAETIGEVIGGRLRDFNGLLYREIAGSLAGDIVSGNIALEYPPYWAHLILQSVSGKKIAITYQLNKNSLTANARNELVGPLLRHTPLFNFQR